MNLSKTFIKENLKKSKHLKFFGKPLEEFCRDELIALVVAGFLSKERSLDSQITTKEDLCRYKS